MNEMQDSEPDFSVPESREDFLRFFADYTSEKRMAGIVDQLKLDRWGGFKAPDKILCVLFASRSGSNYLGSLLSNTPYFNLVGESFRPRQLRRIRDREGLADLYEACQWMIDNRGTEHAFGFKAGFDVLIGAAGLGLLPEIIERVQIILLRRRDRVAQAVSLVKGNLSGRMHSPQPKGRTLTDADYDEEAIVRGITAIARNEKAFAEIARLFGKDAPVIYYEDVCAEPENHVARILETFGLPMPAEFETETRLKIMRDDLNAKWIERFRNNQPEVVSAARG